MRDGELREGSVVADDGSRTIGSDEAGTFNGNDEAKTSDSSSEGNASPGPNTEPDFGDAAHAPLGALIDNRYIVEALIASDAVGVAYRCRHKALGKQVAVKVLRKHVARLSEAPRRLLIEAQCASAIGNEHIVDVTDFGTLPNGSPYFVMELLDGAPLAELSASQGTLPLSRLLAIGKQLAEGLMAAHTAGIVHRDLKPESIFLLSRGSEDFVKILDFGITKIAPTDSLPEGCASVILGTPDYLSPEQAAGSRIDHRVDIYSLGVILYQLATGRVPFHAGNRLELLGKIANEPPPPFRALTPVPAVPPEFEGVVRKCLEKQPGRRFQSMQELLFALRRVEQLSLPPPRVEFSPSLFPPVLREPSASEEPRSHGSLSALSAESPLPSVRSGRWAIHALGATLVLLFSLTWLSYLQRAQPPNSASAALIEAVPLPAPPETLLPEALPAAPPAVAAVEQTAPSLAGEPAQPRAKVRKAVHLHQAAPARNVRAPHPAKQASPARSPAAPTAARSRALRDGLLEPY